MNRRRYFAALLLPLLFASPDTSAQTGWQPLDPEQVLQIDTTKGRLLVEMRPDFAPNAVARVKQLARERFYDGLQFHRVIEHFVAQTGNPDNRDGGVSRHPNLAPEFMFRFKPGSSEVRAIDASDAVSGFFGSVPFEGEPLVESSRRPTGLVRAWGAYCPGVAGMGRQQARDTANSELFFMLDAARRLDRDYTVWGRIVDGMPVLRSLAIGEPPARPDLMTRVRVLADIHPAERVRVSLPPAADVAGRIQELRRATGADFTICDVELGARIAGP